MISSTSRSKGRLMRILTLSTIYPTEHNDSIGRSVAFLDRALAQTGVSGVTLFLRPWIPSFLARRAKRWRHLALDNRVERDNGLAVVYDRYLHLPRRHRLDLSARFMAWKAEKLIRRHRWEFDLIHGQSIFPAGLAAYLLSRKHRVPFVLTLRDSLRHLEDMRSRQRPAFFSIVEAMFRRAKAVFAHGPGILRDLPRYLPKDGSVRAVLAPNGVDVEGIREKVAGFSPSLPRGGRHLVSVGHLFRIKGIHENLEALRILDERGFRDWRYTVVGDGPFRRELQTLTKEWGLEGRVEFSGKVPHREALLKICEGDIFSLPSWEEAFGNVYAEAAVCGRPAIGCRGLGAELTIRDGETGILVPPKDVPALAEALLLLLTHPERARRMGEEAQKHIRQFTWERTARIYKEAIENFLSGGTAH